MTFLGQREARFNNWSTFSYEVVIQQSATNWVGCYRSKRNPRSNGLYKYFFHKGKETDHNLTSITHNTESLTLHEFVSLIIIDTTKQGLSSPRAPPNHPHLQRPLSTPYLCRDTMHNCTFLPIQWHLSWDPNKTNICHTLFFTITILIITIHF